MTKFQTIHPDPDKQGVNIDQDKYEQVKSSILSVLDEHQTVTFKELNSLVKEDLNDFDGSKGWYITTVKLDLEARDVIEVDRSSSPQKISQTEKD